MLKTTSANKYIMYFFSNLDVCSDGRLSHNLTKKQHKEAFYVLFVEIISVVNSLIFLNSGFSTDGDMDNVLLVGPIAPATYRLTPRIRNIYYI